LGYLFELKTDASTMDGEEKGCGEAAIEGSE
jgi:hypothetical protein